MQQNNMIRKGLLFAIMFAVIFTAGLAISTSDALAASHTHSYKVTKTKASTCKKEGYKKYKCKKCGKVKIKTLARKDHTWDHYEMRDPSCTKDGFDRYRCLKCKAKTSITKAKKGHKYKSYKKVSATCQKTGTNYLKCSRCGNKTTKQIKKTGHTYKYMKTVHPEYEKAGVKQYKCRHCDITKKKTIPNVKTTLKHVKAGKTITMQKITFENDIFAPKRTDFEENYDKAKELYDVIVEGKFDKYTLTFNDANEMMEFDTKFNYKVFGNKYDIFYGGSMNMNGWHTYDLIDLRTQIKNAQQANEYAYNACKSAGIKDGMTEKECIVRINNWVCDHLTYCVNSKVYYEAFQIGKGQCHAYAQMLAEMCKVCGIECEYIQGYGMGGPHAWNKVKLSGTWYWIDATWNDDSDFRTDFLLSKKLWGSHEEW